MIRFSLVVATLGRTDELAMFLASVRRQLRTDIEVIVVDQNQDQRLTPLVEEMQRSIPVQHLRVSTPNVSAARNLGLDAANGEIVAFPDDDCWYPDGLLDDVDRWFVANSEYGVLAVGAIDRDGTSSGNRWVQTRCDIRSWNALRTTFCSSLFITAVEQSRQTRFDPNLSRGEETDFILRLLSLGARGRFDKTLAVGHPRRDMLSGTVTRERAISYGAGMGQLVRRHSLNLLWATLLLYDLMRAVLVAARGRRTDAAFCFAHARGLFKGFMLPEASYE